MIIRAYGLVKNVLSFICFLILQKHAKCSDCSRAHFRERESCSFSPDSLRKECVTRASLHSCSECVRATFITGEADAHPSGMEEKSRAWGEQWDTGRKRKQKKDVNVL